MQSLYYRVEERAKHQDEIIALARSLEETFVRLASPDEKPPAADAILKLMDVGFDLNKNKTKEPAYFSIPRRLKPDLSPAEVAYIMEHRDELKGLEVIEESLRMYAVVVPEGGFGRYGAAPIAAKIFQAYDSSIGGLSSPSTAAK